MRPSVKRYERAHAKQAARVLSDLIPEWVVNEQMLLHWEASVPERAQYGQWVAEGEEGVVGYGFAHLDIWTTSPGVGWFWVGVRDPARRGGVGRKMFDAAEEHLLRNGVSKLKTFVREPESETTKFVETRGYRETRREITWVLPPGKADLTGVEEAVRTVETTGLSLLPLKEVRDRPKELYEMFAAAARDIPSDDPVDDIRYEEWLKETYEHPLLDDEASFVWVSGATFVSFTFLVVDREARKGYHELTGTVPEFRKRGLAKLAKLATARWATDNGVSLFTGNDSTNTGMLGINEQMGYEPTPASIQYVKEIRGNSGDE